MRLLNLVAWFQTVVDYTRGKSDNSPTALSESILRTAKLEEMLTEGESTQTSTEGRYRGQGFVVEVKCYKYWSI